MMRIAHEMFRFMTTRRPERAHTALLEGRLLRDGRKVTQKSLLWTLFAAADFAAALKTADAFAAGGDFFADTDPQAAPALAAEWRRTLRPGSELAALAADVERLAPVLAPLLAPSPPRAALEEAAAVTARLWDSLYAQTVRGCAGRASTNYLADALRVHHVLGLLSAARRDGLQAWSGTGFDGYDALIGLDDLPAPSAGRRVATASSGSRLIAPRAGGATLAAPAQPPSAGPAPAAPSAPAAPAALPPPALNALLAPPGQARAALSVGAIQPPAVGDLVLVEQELRRYELGELADIESIMKGERRERSTRTIARTTQTGTRESASEREETSSLKTDERFQLSTQAQKSAEESFSAQAAVNVSAKYGPALQIGASASASYSTSQSSSESTAQEFARNVTEEASKRVRSSIRETSSITVLNETQNSSIRGFNNEKGEGHVNGLYRWVDKIYAARTLNYGRRLMLGFVVPEPAALFRSVLAQKETQLLDGLAEPVPPELVDPDRVTPYPEGAPGTGLASFRHVTEQNYARFAGLYGVVDIPLPPRARITGAKAIVYPSAMEAKQVPEHTGEENELTYVSADNTLTVDPSYKLEKIGVYVPLGKDDPKAVWYAGILKLGAHKNDVNRILVEVGNMSFYFEAAGGSAGPVVRTNFNQLQEPVRDDPLKGALQPGTLPLAISADFEGLLSLTVVYTATLREEALERWKAQAYAAILKGYNARKQEYEQALAVARSRVQSANEAQTFSLRGDQYRSIEQTELKRGCIELMTAGSALGRTSIALAQDGTPRIVHDPAEGAQLEGWRSALENGTVAEFFETAFEWTEAAYQFHPYYWAGAARWKELLQAAGADPAFEQFLRAGSASASVPVRPGCERAVMLFLRTGLIWGGGYLPLFGTEDMLDVYADVEQSLRLDASRQVGDPWEIRLPTNMVMLQEDAALPEFPAG